MGSGVYSVEDKIRIRIYVKDLTEFEKYLPTGRLCEQLTDAVFFYLGDEFGLGRRAGSSGRQDRALEAWRGGAARLDQLDGAELGCGRRDISDGRPLPPGQPAAGRSSVRKGRRGDAWRTLASRR